MKGSALIETAPAISITLDTSPAAIAASARPYRRHLDLCVKCFSCIQLGEGPLAFAFPGSRRGSCGRERLRDGVLGGAILFAAVPLSWLLLVFLWLYRIASGGIGSWWSDVA